MILLILWIFVLIIWIVNLILRTRPSMKNTTGNGLHIFIAVLFIMLAIVNIIGEAISLNNKSAKTETLVETVASDEEFIQDECYITDEGY